MSRKSLIVLGSALLVTMVGISSTQDAGARSKKWTITDRQERLKKEIDQGEKSGDLTANQAEELRKEETKIEAKEEKMKADNNGKISVTDQNTIEKCLNKLSVRIQKWKLAKRVK